MPYKDKAKRAAYMRDYRDKKIIRSKINLSEIEKASKTLFEGLNLQICDALEEGQIMALPTTREGLKEFHFTCSICKERKTADHMTLVQKPLKTEQTKKENYVFTISQEQLICCDTCADKHFPIHVWPEEGI